jgi:uncharacterized membrane protein YcaP (DUF421 family)
MLALVVWLNGTGQNMLDLPATVTLLEKVLRPALVYLFLVVCLRLFGKRELAQLNPFDLVVLLSVSNAVQNAIIGNDNSTTGGMLGALSLFVVNYLVVRFVFKHRRLDQMLEGKPAVLIEHGRLRPHALAKELLTKPELVAVAHRQGYASLGEVESCVLEPGGTFFMEGKTSDARRHAELLGRLEQLSRQIEDLRRAPPAS